MQATMMSVSGGLMKASPSFERGRRMAHNIAEGRKGLGGSVGSMVTGLVGIVIAAYFAAELVPEAVTQFQNNNLSGSEGVIFGLSGLVVVAGFIFGLMQLMGLD